MRIPPERDAQDPNAEVRVDVRPAPLLPKKLAGMLLELVGEEYMDRFSAILSLVIVAILLVYVTGKEIYTRHVWLVLLVFVASKTSVTVILSYTNKKFKSGWIRACFLSDLLFNIETINSTRVLGTDGIISLVSSLVESVFETDVLLRKEVSERISRVSFFVRIILWCSEKVYTAAKYPDAQPPTDFFSIAAIMLAYVIAIVSVILIRKRRKGYASAAVAVMLALGGGSDFYLLSNNCVPCPMFKKIDDNLPNAIRDLFVTFDALQKHWIHVRLHCDRCKELPVSKPDVVDLVDHIYEELRKEEKPFPTMAHVDFGLSSNPDEMFDASVLESMDITVPEGIRVRPLRRTDYNKGFLEVLGQLTAVGDVSVAQFNDRFDSMRNTRPKSYYVVILEDIESSSVVGAATLVIEWKFIHQAGCRGRVEDVVVDKSKRGLKLEAVLNKVLVFLAKKVGVYKLSLECTDSLIDFYEAFGYKKDEGNNFLVQRFDGDKLDSIPSNI